MLKLTCVLLILALNINLSHQFIKHGRCHFVRSNPFDLYMFKGNWYEVQKTPHPSKIPGRCTSHNILFNNVNHGTIFNRHITHAKMFDSQQCNLEVIREQYYTFLEITCPGVPKKSYQLLATDYNYYAILYSCTPLTLGLNPTNDVQVSIWSRYPIITPATRSLIRAALLQKGIKECEDYLNDCDQTNCPR